MRLGWGTRMTGEVVGLEEVVLEPPAALTLDKRRFGLFLFGGALMLLINFGDPAVGVISVPVSFFLKDRLHLSAHDSAVFKIWVGLPLFFSFVFGFLRDRWSPFGTGDRGNLMLFGVVTAAIYAGLAFLTPTYAVLMAGMLLATAVFQVVLGAGSGLIAGIGQDRAMAGQMSTLLGIAVTAPALMSYLAGGALSDYLDGKGANAAALTMFLTAAGLLLAVAVLAAFRPRALFSGAAIAKPDTHFFQDIGRLLKHWPVYPVILIQILWQFSPGSGTVLQYHMSNALHATDFEWGAWNAVFLGSFVPMFVGYGFLCQRFALSRLLWVGFGLAVFQMVPLLFVHSAVGAIIAACPMGIIGGVAQAALTDLAIRSCPKGLQGTMMLLFGASIYYIAARFGDLLGTEIYDHHGGFFPAVWLTIIIYALILPALLLVPKHLIATRDGQALQ
jgi:MFS family permease